MALGGSKSPGRLRFYFLFFLHEEKKKKFLTPLYPFFLKKVCKVCKVCSTLFTTPLRFVIYIPSDYQPPLPPPPRRPSSFCFRPDARGSGQAHRPRDGFGAPAETHAPPGSPDSSIGWALETPARSLVIPPPAKLAVALRRASLGSKARPPALRSHAHTCHAAQAAVSHRLRSACGSLHPAPSSSPASQAAHNTKCAGLCGAHTVGPRSLHGGARRYRGRTARVFFAATARAAFLLGDRLPTHSLTTAHGPPCAAHHPLKRHARRPDARGDLRGLALRVFAPA